MRGRSSYEDKEPTKLSVVVPCYNEESTLVSCVRNLLNIQSEELSLEIIVVDDCSSDKSLSLARSLAVIHPEITVVAHEINRGKGAALRTGFAQATGEIVAVQDADLEYDPQDLIRLVQPIIAGRADVVFGSRFLSSGEHRVLYFWHSLVNKGLTFFSNMFTDLNLTDMETCYKVFRREIIKSITIEEDRFGFEPEIVAKVAQMRVRIMEAGISYYGRTYDEGKKIGWKDGIRALYCIFHYNAPKSPLPIQLIIYLFLGGVSGLLNLLVFLGLIQLGSGLSVAAAIAYVLAAALNYVLCVFLLFRHKARWNSSGELAAYVAVVAGSGLIDVLLTEAFTAGDMSSGFAKAWASVIVLAVNFYGRKYIVFPEKPLGDWKAQQAKEVLGVRKKAVEQASDAPDVVPL